MKAVVVSTHLDDAVISAGSVLGRSTLVITVFAGVPRGLVVGWWDAACGVPDSQERMRDRRREDAAALRRYGASYVHLDFLGGQHVRGYRKRDDLVRRIAAGLEPLFGGAGDVYAPTGIGHPEHAQVRDAVLSVHPTAILYADLPYATHAVTECERPSVIPRAHSVRRDAPLSARAFRRKVGAARCYASQIGPLELVFGDFLTKTVLGREVYWSPDIT
jgi:hypothetical protein